MFNVTINFGEQAQWVFMFTTQGRAREVQDQFVKNKEPGTLLVIGDDYGSEAAIVASSVHGIIIEDMSKTGDAAIERSIVHARNQAKFQSKAQGDTIIKMSQPLTPPMPNGPFMRS